MYRRRQAIRRLAPFTAAIVAIAESWLYINGTLCHILERTLRVLDLHQSSGEETIIDVRALLDEAVTECRGSRKYRFQVLHYAEGIVSCLYTHSRRPHVESWLIVFNVQERRLLTSLPLDTAYKIFVRNDSNYLYFGTHSEFGEDGFRRWVLMGYNIQENRWFEQKVHLLDMVGSDIGQSIAFEIIDGKFYGLSSQASFEIDEADWTSFYHCFRFPVAAPKPKETERSIKSRMWRRQHAEGPIDDRWSFIRLIKDDRNPNRLQVLESRKEWLKGQSSGRRNYYTTELVFPPTKEADQNEDGSNSNSNPNNIGGGIYMNPITEAERLLSDSRRYTFDLPRNPEYRTRCPFTTHPGDDASTALMFTLSKCFVRSYHPSSQTFLDLVDNPSPHAPDTPRLQLRAGTRQLLPEGVILGNPAALDASLPHTERIKHMYRNKEENEIIFWPPDNPEDAQADPAALDDLHKLLNPPSHTGSVKGAWDDRSVLYSTSHADGLQALVFISFDPAIRMPGLREWGGESAECGSGAGKGVEIAAENRAAEGGDGESWAKEGEGKGKEVAVDLTEDSQDAIAFYSPTNDEDYASGWSPSFDSSWAGDFPSQAISCEEAACEETPCEDPHGEEIAASAAASTAIGTSSGDGNGAACRSVARDSEPCDASIPAAGNETMCKWAKTEPAMYHKIAYGFNGIPDFNSPGRKGMRQGKAAMES